MIRQQYRSMIRHQYRSPVGDDERFCRDLTRREAKNFYWGFIALPRQQRHAIYALYSFARQVDDEVDLCHDGALDPLALVERCRRHRIRLDSCFEGQGCDAVMRVLAHVVRDYGIPRRELEGLIDGVEMDVRCARYPGWEDLQVYCRHVASAVGRMCVRVFGFSDPAALDYADELGMALQLINILRDVREDAQLGRVYLPLRDLRHFDVGEEALLAGEPGAGWEPLVRCELDRARGLLASGLRVTTVIPRRSAACVLTMAGIYAAIMEEIERNPSLPLERRASLDKRQKLAVMMRSWLQVV
ncbi:MAG: squalene/phytoene synthase family protein [Chloroflexi bacterium]|nr:squalene/phytoene synthase family protein [Chloroflexota bacterium]